MDDRSNTYLWVRAAVRVLFRLAVFAVAFMVVKLLFATVWASFFWIFLIAAVGIVMMHKNKQSAVVVSSGHTLEEICGQAQ